MRDGQTDKVFIKLVNTAIKALHVVTTLCYVFRLLLDLYKCEMIAYCILSTVYFIHSGFLFSLSLPLCF